MEILHECENFLVVNKPYDMYINSEDPNETNTVACKLAQPDSHLHTSQLPLHFVHRLDYATSGVLCLAKNKLAAKEAGRLFEKRLAQKYYLAVVRGCVKFDCCDVNYPIAEDQSTCSTNHKMLAVTDTSSSTNCKSKSASTRMLVMEHGSYNGDPATIVLLKPLTGRRHQLRVHCHSIGYTILGDYTYSDRKDNATHRMFLHAIRLILPLKTLTLDTQTSDPFKEDEIFVDKWKTKTTLHSYVKENLADLINMINTYELKHGNVIKFPT